MKEQELMKKFNHRIKEIKHYHERFRDFPPGDDDGAATYGVVMRTQVQALLELLEEVQEHVQR